SVALYEDTIVVGSYLDESNGDNSGSAHIFIRSGETWTHQAKLPPAGAASDLFGKSTAVAVYKDTIAVGAYGDDNIGNLSGSAYVLPLKNLDWNAGGVTTSSGDSLLPVSGQGSAAPQTPPPSKDPITGQTAPNLYLAPSSSPATFSDIPSISLSATPAPSLAADNQTPVLTTNAPSSNPVKIPTLSPTKNPTNVLSNLFPRPPVLTWKLLLPEGTAADYYGESVTVYGDTVVVGAPWDDDNGRGSGSAHVFVRIGEEWKHQAKLLSPDWTAGDGFGESVATYGDTVVVGTQYHDENGDYSGSAHVFVRNGDEWTHQAKLLAPDGAKG
ncbi:hypothetical protein THAOC_19489, partial [Thalassiosira oceanica]